MSDIFDLPDLDLEDMGDPYFGDPDTGSSKKRKVITEFGGSVLNTAKSTVLSKGSIKRMIQLSLGDGYSQAISTYDNLSSDIKQTFGENEQDVKTLLSPLTNAADKRGGLMSRLIPSWLKETEDDYLEYEQRADKLDADIDSIGDLLKFQVSSTKQDLLNKAKEGAKARRSTELQLTGLQSIGDGIGRLVSYQDSVTHSYYGKSLELGFRKLDVLTKTFELNRATYQVHTEVLKAIAKNTGLPDVLKTTSKEFIEADIKTKLAARASDTIANLGSSYLGDIKSNFSNMIQSAASASSLAGSIGGGGAGPGKAGMAGMVGGGLLGDVLSSLLENKASEYSERIQGISGIRKGNNKLRGLLTNVPLKMADWTRSEARDSKFSPVEEFFKNLMYRGSDQNSISGGNITDLTNPHQWNLQSHRTLNEVIPAFLSSMDRSLVRIATGEDVEEKRWSHYDRELVGKEEYLQQHLQLTTLDRAGNSIGYQVDTLMRQIGVEDLTKESKRALRIKLLSKMRQRNNFNPEDYVKHETWADEKEYVAEELILFFSERFGITTDGTRLDTSEDFKEDLNNIQRKYGEVAASVPNVVGRMDTLSTITGRAELRELGLTSKDGYGGDIVNERALVEALLGDEDYDYDATRLEDLAEQAKQAEKVSSVIDTMSKFTPEVLKKQGRKLFAGADGLIDQAITRMETFDVEETKEFLELAKAGNIEQVKAKYAWAKGLSKEEIIDLGETKLKSIQSSLSSGFASARRTASELADKAMGKLDEHAPGLRDAMATATSDATNKLDEISPGLNDSISNFTTQGKESVINYTNRIKRFLSEHTLSEMTVMAKAYSQEELPGQLSEISDRTMEEAKELFEFLNETKAGAAISKTIKSTEKVVDAVKGKASTLRRKDKTSATLDPPSTLTTTRYEDSPNQETDGGGPSTEFGDFRAHELLEELNSTQVSTQVVLTEILESVMGLAFQGEGKPMEDISDVHQRNRSTRLNRLSTWMRDRYGKIGSKMPAVKSLATSAGRMAWRPVGLFGRYLRGSFSLMGKGVTLGAKAIGYGRQGVGKLTAGLFSQREGLGGSDIVSASNPEDILIKASVMRNGGLIDVNSNKPIKSIEDITGAVVDASGNTLITQEEFDAGLTTAGGESIAGFAGRKALGLASAYGRGTLGFYKGIGRAAKATVRIIKDDLTKYDAYFPGEETPRIRAVLLRKGFYTKEDHTPYTSIDEIDDTVYDPDGNIVISAEELQEHGEFVKKNGGKLWKIGSAVMGSGKWAVEKLTKAATWYAKTSFKVMRGIGKATLGILKSPLTLYKKIRGTATKSEEGFKGASLELAIQQLTALHAINDSIKSGQSDSGQGSKPRANSWEDIQNKRRLSKEATLNDVVNAITAFDERTTDRLDGLLAGEKKSLKDKAKGAWDSVKGAAGSLFGKGSLLRRAGGAVMTAGGFVKGAGILGGLKSAAVGLGSLTIGAIGVTGAVVLGAAAALGIAGYVGYKMWSKSKAKKMVLHWLRMVQYGIDPTDKSQVDAMGKLETLTSKLTTVNEGKKLKVDFSKMSLESVMGVLDIPEEVVTKASTNPGGKHAKRITNLTHWLQTRFLQVYTSHASAMLDATGTTDLMDVDGQVKGHKAKTFLDTVESDSEKLSRIYLDRSISPFSKKLWAEPSDITEAIERARVAIDKQSNDEIDKPTMGAVFSERKQGYIDEIKNNSTLDVSIDGTADITSLSSKIDVRGQSVRSLSARNGVQASDKTSLAKRLDAMDVVTAVRFAAYGLKEMTMSKVEQLWKLEEYILGHQSNAGAFTYPDDGEVIMARIFRLSEDKDLDTFTRAHVWYAKRFIPVLKHFYDIATDMGATDIREANRVLSKLDIKSLLSSVLTIDTIKGVNPWDVTESPWAGYVSGVDTSVTDVYMKIVDQAVEGIVLRVDGENRVRSIKDTTKDELETKENLDKVKDKSPDEKRSFWQKLTGTGKTSKATADGKSTGGSNVKSVESGGEIYTTGEAISPKKGAGKEAGEKAIVKAAIKHGITDPKEISMILAQTAAETGSFNAVEENLRYKKDTLMRVWPNRFAHKPQFAAELAAAGPEAIANSVYGNRMGNTEPGDGWKYRGRGFIQLTGKDNYRQFSKRAGIDVVENPDLVATDPNLAAESAIHYWLSRGKSLSGPARRGDVRAATKIINGGYNGLEHRRGFFNHYVQAMEKGLLETLTSSEEPEVKEEIPGTEPMGTPSDASSAVDASVASNVSESTSTPVVPATPVVVTKRTEVADTDAAASGIEAEKPTHITKTKAPELVLAANRPAASTVADQQVKSEMRSQLDGTTNELLTSHLATLNNMDGTLISILEVLTTRETSTPQPGVQTTPDRRTPVNAKRMTRA